MHPTSKIEAAKREYGSLFTSISEALFKADPAHINFEANTGEYDSEVGAIIPRLKTAQSAEDVQNILWDELFRSFWTYGVSRDALPSLAAELWTLWCDFNRR
jgi:hypothetical protein